MGPGSGSSRAPSYRTRPEWTVAVKGQDHTEMSTRQLVELFAIRTIDENTLIWRDGMDTWKTPFHIPEIAAALKQRGFEPPAGTPGSHDSFDASWTAGEDGFNEATVGIASRQYDAPEELKGALVGVSKQARRPATPGSTLAAAVADHDEPTVAVNAGRLRDGVKPDQAQQRPADNLETYRPPAETAASAERGPVAVPRPSPLKPARVQQLAAETGRAEADATAEDEEATVARPSPLIESERARMAAKLDAQLRADSLGVETTTPARSSPLSDAERDRLASRLDQLEAGAADGERTPAASPAHAPETLRGPGAAGSDRPTRPAELPRALPWAALASRPPAANWGARDHDSGSDSASAGSAAAEPAEPAAKPDAASELQHADANGKKPDAESSPALGATGPEPEEPAGDESADAAVAAPESARPRRTGRVWLALGTVLVLVAAAAVAAVLLMPTVVSRYVPIDRLWRATEVAPEQPSATATGAPSAASLPQPPEPSPASPTDSAKAAGPGAPEEAGTETLRPFDRDAGRRALGIAAGGAAKCRQGPGPTRTGQVEVTFAPEGHAVAVRLTGNLGGSNLAGCVKETFRHARVPAFSGDPVTIGRLVVVPGETVKAAPAPQPPPEPAEPEPTPPPKPEPAQPEKTAPAPQEEPPPADPPSPYDDPSPY